MRLSLDFLKLADHIYVYSKIKNLIFVLHPTIYF